MTEGEGMTDRHRGYIVTLEENTREDDAEVTVSAIEQLRGVASVTPVVASAEGHMAREQARHELTRKVFKALMQGEEG